MYYFRVLGAAPERILNADVAELRSLKTSWKSDSERVFGGVFYISHCGSRRRRGVSEVPPSGSAGYAVMGKTADWTDVQKTVINTFRKEGKMEACMMKPEAKKKPTPIKRNEAEREVRPTPLMPPQPTDASYLTDIFDQEEQTDDVPIRQASSNKPGILKGVMKELQFRSSSKASKEWSPDPSAEKTSSEKEQLGETNKEQHNAEHKRDEGSLLKTGMFWKTPKERSSSPAVKVSKADSDSEDVEKKEEKTSEPTHEKGGFCSGILKMSNKPADETFTQEKGGIFSGIFRKSPKPAETHRDKDVLQSDLSANSENLPENTNVKEKGNMFSGMFRRSPKPSEGSQLEEENLAADRDDSGSSDSLSETGSRK
ncbi:hypothetical protein ATANTOWER_000328, partial [Ataeniobius toweri]|nr:hypothetical protein [Ataeniobius toweri]